MSLPLSACSDPSEITIKVPGFTLFRLKGLFATEQLKKREGQTASRGIFQPKFPHGWLSNTKSYLTEMKL